MKQTTQRFTLLALLALTALFVGCKGESPTAPPPITGTSGNGSGSTGGQPPVGANIALTVSSASPFTGSTSTITATVTLNNAPVPNGTAVEFATTSPNANFTDTSDNPTTLIRTTTNGVAKATVTSSSAGPVVVTVTVNNVTKSVTLNFQDPVINPPPTSTAPTISSISPASGLPTGNQSVVITGTNFRTPVRVLFDPGNGQTPKEGFVTSVTPTQITVNTPAFDLGVAQQIVASITVIVEAGTPAEQRVTKSAAFTITAPVLTPVVRALSPTSGPIDGGTRVTITGDAFEAPAQVFFGSAQAQVLNVTFHTIDVITPTARDTNPNGSGTVTGPVDVRVLNVNSGKSVIAAAAFRYVSKAQITAITPDQGPFTGGTRVLIDGTGFNEPVTVYLDGIAASVVKVTPTEITAISNGIAITGCSDATGPVVVTNVDNGDTATAPVPWIYRVLKPLIVGVSAGGSIQPGSSVSVSVINVGQFPSLSFGTTLVPITSSTPNASNGTTTLTAVVPTTIQLQTQACAAGGAAPIATSFPVVVTNLETGCTVTLNNGLTVNPVPVGRMTLTPNPLALTATAGVAGNPSATPPVPAVPPQPGNGAFTIINTGAAPLTISSVVSSNPAVYTVVADPSGTTLAVCDTAVVGVRYGPEAAGTSSGAQITVSASTGTGTLAQTITARESVTGTTH
jgi:hypothetical protein